MLFCPFKQSSIAEKVNTADLESLIPKSDDGSSLLPLVMEIQQKVATLEGKVAARKAVMKLLICTLVANALPPDLIDQVESMQATIGQLTAELSSVS